MKNMKSSLCIVVAFSLVFINNDVKSESLKSESLEAESVKFMDAKVAIEKAETARLEAKKRGFEWNTTSKLIGKARDAEKNGDQITAIKLAEKALKEAENSIKQADYAENNWQKFAL